MTVEDERWREEAGIMLKVYRIPASVRILYFVAGCGCVFFAFLALIAALNNQKNLAVVLFAVFGLVILGGAAVFLFLRPLTRIEITEHAIGAYRLGRGISLRWEEIGKVKNKAAEDLTLISVEGDKKVGISSQLLGFGEIIELLREKRPDLWMQRVFHGRVGVPVFIALCGIGLIVAGMFGLKESVWAGILLILFGSGAFTFLSQLIWLADIQGNKLRLKSALRERSIPAAEIKAVWLRDVSANMTAVSYSVLLELANEKRIPLVNFREGDPVLYNSLKLWLQEQRIQEAGLAVEN